MINVYVFDVKVWDFLYNEDDNGDGMLDVDEDYNGNGKFDWIDGINGIGGAFVDVGYVVVIVGVLVILGGVYFLVNRVMVSASYGLCGAVVFLENCVLDIWVLFVDVDGDGGFELFLYCDL